ncbi:hypothetical protein FA13DRAFT_1791965 [Coprinellus micaceus]|uniref:Uncharacterized protein n=1 Tax=Coprinellus micaceus TaxID=71717 RepID=A0A4Y7TB59_COPMI|nr:hypothetical protein FA13DRAFT_1791965 [Coprinellus micaceus]
MQPSLPHPPSVQHPPAYEEVVTSQTNNNTSPKTWHDIEVMFYRCGISSAPAHPNVVASAPQNWLDGRVIASAIILASNRPEVERELGGLVDEFDEAWLEIQRAAYLFYSNSAALRRCGHRLYALQQQYYTAGRYDMAVAIDPILEAVDARMPDLPTTPALTATASA